ncbi:MAG: hypothetical protein KatS3mg019_2541 [Fimbriimonadales bacterium]|nr:MAG: hypothetical protein KatS3mg019_2541 [Fimbriimonadales bacterium]
MRAVVCALLCAWLTNAWAETEIFLATLAKFDPENSTIVLKRTGKPDMNATLHKKPRLWLGKQPVDAEQFRTMEGKRVMVRVSVGTQVRPVVREMADPDTWKWLEKVRRGVVKGTLVGVEDSYLLMELPDKTRFAYKFTPKTRFERDGKPATIEDFAIGETLYIAPRLLSNLDTMLLSVSNTEKDANIARERALPSIQGTIQNIDRQKKILKVLTRAGDLREIRYDENTEFTFKGKAVKVEQIKPPARATIHRTRDAEGNDYARKVTIQPNS